MSQLGQSIIILGTLLQNWFHMLYVYFNVERMMSLFSQHSNYHNNYNMPRKYQSLCSSMSPFGVRICFIGLTTKLREPSLPHSALFPAIWQVFRVHRCMCFKMII